MALWRPKPYREHYGHGSSTDRQNAIVEVRAVVKRHLSRQTLHQRWSNHHNGEPITVVESINCNCSALAPNRYRRQPAAFVKGLPRSGDPQNPHRHQPAAAGEGTVPDLGDPTGILTDVSPPVLKAQSPIWVTPPSPTSARYSLGRHSPLGGPSESSPTSARRSGKAPIWVTPQDSSPTSAPCSRRGIPRSGGPLRSLPTSARCGSEGTPDLGDPPNPHRRQPLRPWKACPSIWVTRNRRRRKSAAATESSVPDLGDPGITPTSVLSPSRPGPRPGDCPESSPTNARCSRRRHCSRSG